MSDSREKQSVTNGTSSSVTDPLQRLSSFKTPRDLSLGGAKPSKKVFTPNLNISRNKKGPNLPTVTRDKSHDKGKKDRKSDRNRNIKNGPNIIKSSGVFSEGVAASEIRSSRAYVGGSRDSDAAPVLQKPFIRVKDVYKIDKELEEQKIRSALGAAADEASDEEAPDALADSDAPVRLPLSDGGWLHSKPKASIKVKQEVIVKEEPTEDCSMPSVDEKKAIPDVKKDVSEETDIVSLLRSDKPTLIMLQFPDTLPGRAAAPEDDAPKRKDKAQPSSSTEPAAEDTEEKPDPDRCRLADLQEGRVGRLLIRRSGRVEIQLGDTMFDVAAGTPCSFRQEAVSVAVDEDSRSANLVSLGALPHKLNILPNWEALLADMALY